MAEKKKGGGTPHVNRRDRTHALRPKDRTQAEQVDCPNLGRSGHGSGCGLCHGSGKIDAIK